MCVREPKATLWASSRSIDEIDALKYGSGQVFNLHFHLNLLSLLDFLVAVYVHALKLVSRPAR